MTMPASRSEHYAVLGISPKMAEGLEQLAACRPEKQPRINSFLGHRFAERARSEQGYHTLVKAYNALYIPAQQPQLKAG